MIPPLIYEMKSCKIDACPEQRHSLAFLLVPLAPPAGCVVYKVVVVVLP
jgi:hypothetical protein